ncbi:MAG: branched-chain amino acid ABC transporter permease [Streptosporangiaceae bacterium]
MYYLITLLVYGSVDAIACLGLSLQFGVGGVTNFGFIIFQAAGAYTAAVLALPPDSASGGFQSYIAGWHLPFPLPWIGAAVVGAALALPFTFLVGRRLRGDFAAIGLLVTAVLANLLVMDYKPLLNGDAGVALVPAPLQSQVMTTAPLAYQWEFAGAIVVLAAGVFWFVRHITESPYGRTLRAMRDNDTVADSLGKNLLSLRTGMLVLGGAIAGLSGGVLVSFISVWSPAALDLRRDDRALRGRDHRGPRQPSRCHHRRGAGPRRLRGSHPADHQREPEPAAQPAALAAMGRHRAAHRLVPVVPAAGHPAGAQAGHRPARQAGGASR